MRLYPNPLQPTTSVMMAASANDNQLIADLQKVGANVSSIFDLVSSREPLLPEVAEVLLSHLDLEHTRWILEGIVRALGNRSAPKETFGRLYRLFKTDQVDVNRWAVANTMEIIARQGNISELLDLVADRKYGSDRQMLAVALGRVGKGDKRALAALVALLDDDDVLGHAVIGLRILSDSDALSSLQKVDRARVKKWVQKELDDAIRKLSGDAKR